MEHFPLVTVITAVFNGADTIERCIRSVAHQAYENVQHIVIDGGSTDGTQDIIRKYEADIDYWVSETDAGIYDAWNKGLEHARGEWIAFLGADDAYTVDALEAYVHLLNQHSGIPIEYVSARVNLIANNKLVRTVGRPWSWKTFRKYMNVAHVGSLHHRSLFERFGRYDLQYRICGDYELLLRPGSALHTLFLNRVTVEMNVGGVSGTSFKAFDETARAKEVTGKRPRWLCLLERFVAVSKWKVRSQIWY